MSTFALNPGSGQRRRRSIRQPVAIALAAGAILLGRPARATEDKNEPKNEPGAVPAPPTSPPSATPSVIERPVVVWPAMTPAGDDAGPTALHKPLPAEGTIHARAQELDATLRDAVQDLGFTLDVADPGPSAGRSRDLDLIERASHSSARGGAPDNGTWVVSARLEHAGGDTYLLRIVAVPPRGKQLRVRVERVSGADVSVRGLVLLRDLLTIAAGTSSDGAARPQESTGFGVVSPLRSQGRAVLAANAALFGAYVAFSVQRASGSEDPRLLYPLLALGTGVGLGSALLVAEEWDVGTGDAWTLAGGAWWGAGAGLLIANGRKVQPLTDRYAWGVGGGLVGLGLATFALTRGKADEGDAVLVHSGAALGLSLGGLGELFYHGDLERTPHTGTGYGAAIGLVGAGTLATLVQVSPSRVLLIDLGAGLGAAAGAAVGSPLVFEDLTTTKTRGFLAATVGGTLAGGAIAWWLTRARPPVEKSGSAPVDHAGRRAAPRAGATRADDSLRMVPFGGVIGASATPHGSEPAYGVGVRGSF